MDIFPKLNKDNELYVLPFANNEEYWLDCENVIDAFCEGILNKSGQKTKRSNVARDFRKHAQVIDGKNAISMSAVIQYAYNHRQKCEYSKIICQNIEAKLGFKRSNIDSVLDIYKDTAKQGLYGDAEVDAFIAQNVDLDDNECKTIHTEHRDLFTPNEWKHIALFESHFHQRYGENGDYDQEVDLKRKFFISLAQMKTISSNLDCVIKSSIDHRAKRRKQAAKENEVSLVFEDGGRHKPGTIESDIISEVRKYLPKFIGSVLCFDCTYVCSDIHTSNAVHVVIEMKGVERTMTNMDFLCSETRRVIESKHMIHCGEIIFVKDIPSNEGRFLVRDRLLSKQLAGVIHTIDLFNGTKSFEILDCDECYPQRKLNPLHWKNFHLTQEWYVDVPLEIQILFSGFLNKETLQDTSNITRYMHKKIVRLYGLYDALLNTRTKFHVGIIQEMNSTHLMVHYKNIGESFKVAQQMGIVQSQATADRGWKKFSSEEEAYYQYAIEKVPLEYVSIKFGAGIHMVFIH